MSTIDPLQLDKVKKILDGMDPATRAYAEAMIPMVWDKVENNIDALIALVEGITPLPNLTLDELTAKLKASNDASDALHAQTEDAKAKTRAFIRNLVMLFITTILGE